tara:strand:+ start:22753 stop:25188 length:2436 start_codon:yes stop_codon:yes gene_type:complete
MDLKTNKIFLSFILLLGISFPQLLNKCGNELPVDNSSYESYLSCKSKGAYDDYFIGDVISTGNSEVDKKSVQADLSNSIGVYIESSLEEQFSEDDVSYIVDDIVINDYNVQHYLIHTLKAESNNYIQNPIFVQLVSNSGLQHWVAFKNKKDFESESDETNNFILDQLSYNWKIYKGTGDNSEKYQALFTSYLLGNCVSGSSIGKDNSTLSEILDIKRQVDAEFYEYLNSIEFSNSSKNKIEISAWEKMDDEININIIDKNSNNRKNVIPTRVRAFISTGEFDKSISNSSRKKISFKIPMITSSTTNQDIYFYPEIPLIGSIRNDIDKKMQNEKNKLNSYLKKEAETGKFGVIKLKVTEEISLNYNRDVIMKQFGYGSIASLDLPDGSRYKTILDFIEQIFKENPQVKLSKNSDEMVYFPITANRSKKQVIFKGDDKNIKTLQLKIGKSNFYKDWRISSSSWTSSNRNKFKKLVNAYINTKIAKMKKVIVDCALCNNDELRYYTSKGPKSGLMLNKNKGSFNYDKGSLEKIELIRKVGRDEYVYLTINSRDIKQELLFSNSTIELSEIVKDYLKRKDLYDNNKNLIEGTRVCFQEIPITYHLVVPPEYRSKKIKVLYNGSKKNIKKDGTLKIIKNNMSKGNLFFEGNGLSIKKSLDNKNKTKGNLFIPTSYKIDKYYDKNIYLEWKPKKIGWDDVLIPGMSNFNLLKSEKNTKLWGIVKMFTFAALSGIAYSEYDLYQEHLEQYELYKNGYNNCIDCPLDMLNNLRNNASESYDLMTEHQTNYNIAIFGVGSLYTYNIIEFSMKLGKRRLRK